MQKTDTCWLWTGAKAKGYGVLGKGPKNAGYIQAHRFSYELHRGPIPDGRSVLHNCPGGDNPSCVNPDHLSTGGPAENGQDASRKGQIPTGDAHYTRQHPEKRTRGEQHGRAKLIAEQVRAIRQRYSKGGIFHRQLAEEYGVSPATIGLIITRRIWSHLE